MDCESTFSQFFLLACQRQKTQQFAERLNEPAPVNLRYPPMAYSREGERSEMDAITAIQTRRSVRHFKSDPVPDELVRQVVQAAGYAPSAHNGQPWEFIVTRNDDNKRKLDEGHKYTRFLPRTPVVIVVCARFPESPRRISEAKGVQYMCVQDSAAAIQNMLLAAHALGLGTCWVGDFTDSDVKEMFGIPDPFAPVALIALGYPEKMPPRAPKRRDVEEIIHWEKF